MKELVSEVALVEDASRRDHVPVMVLRLGILEREFSWPMLHTLHHTLL